MRLRELFIWIFVACLPYKGAYAAVRRRLSANIIAKKILESSMDLTQNPCIDFFNYACGNWMESHKRNTDNYQEIISQVNYITNRDIGKYLKSLILHRQPEFVRTVHKYFRSCLDVDEYEPLKYLEWLTEHERLDWSLLQTDSEFDWLRKLAILRRYGFNGIFIEQYIIQQAENASVGTIDLDKPVQGGGLQLMTYQNLKLIFQNINEPLRCKSGLCLWSEIREFEQRLKILESMPDPDGILVMKFKDLPLAWLKRYLRIVFMPEKLNPNMDLYVQNLPYFAALDDLINEYEPSFLNKYLEIRFLYYLDVQSPRALALNECVRHVRSVLPHATEWLYGFSMNPELEEDVASIHYMFQRLSMQFDKILTNNKNNFLSSELEFLLRKLHSIQLKVGNLPRVNATEILEDFYRDLQLDPDNFYGNLLKVLKFNVNAVQRNLQQSLRYDDDKYFFIEEPSIEVDTGSLYFIKRANIVVLSMAMLQLPVYHPSLNNIYKYSLLGFLLAHEMMHAFDKSGLTVDSNRQMNATIYDIIVKNTEFDANLNCLMSLDPEAIDEKISDISALRLAYETYYTMHPEMHNKTFHVNGEEMSSAKVFLLNLAQFFCGTGSGSTEHGSDYDRLIHAVQHFDHFSDIYQCPLGSPMYPDQNNCQLWRR